MACLGPLASAGTNAAGVDSFIADFDWLVATNGKEEFRKPLLTLNREDLQRFVTTGTRTSKLQIGLSLTVESHAGTYYSTEAFPDTSLDIPASVVIKFRDKVVAGAKGLQFRTTLSANRIMIEHWDLTIDCSLARWYLEFKLEPNRTDVDLQVVGSEYVLLGTDEQCTPT